jgi:hypothetical protein
MVGLDDMASALAVDERRVPGVHGLPLVTELFDAQRHQVTGFEEYGLGLDAQAHPRRRAGGDEVTRVECHELAQVADDLRHREDHGPGIAGLEAFAIHVQPHAELVHVAHFVAGHQPRPGGAEGIAALALVPLAAALELELAL